MSVSLGAGKGGFQIGCFTTPFVGTLVVILLMVTLWEVSRMRQDINLLKGAYAGTPAMVDLISKAKIHSDNAREELRRGRTSSANEQIVLVGDTMNQMDEQIRSMQKDSQRQYPSVVDFLGGVGGYLVNFFKGLLGI